MVVLVNYLLYPSLALSYKSETNDIVKLTWRKKLCSYEHEAKVSNH